MISLWKLVGVETFTFICLQALKSFILISLERKNAPTTAATFLPTDWLNFQLRSLSLWGA